MAVFEMAVFELAVFETAVFEKEGLPWRQSRKICQNISIQSISGQLSLICA